AIAGLAANCIVATAAPSIPLFFLPGRSHTSSAARYMARGAGLNVYFRQSEVDIQMRDAKLTIDFPGASSSSRIEPLDPMPGVANLLEGPPEQWRRNVPLYGRVTYRDLYPGIDLIYGSTGRKLKSEFVVAPQADPSKILMRYMGADVVELGSDGSLTVK